MFLGIDLTTKEQKPTACAILDEHGGLVSVTKLSTDDDMVALAEAHSPPVIAIDRKSTRLNSSHKPISYAVFCLKKKT